MAPDLGALRRVFEADRVAVFERGELHATDKLRGKVRPIISGWRADAKGRWRPFTSNIYRAPAPLWRRLVLEAETSGSLKTPAPDPGAGTGVASPQVAAIKSWKVVSAVLDVSPWTVSRRRRERGDKRRPYFASAQEAHAWWAELNAGPPPKSTRSRGGRRRRDTVADDEFTLANLEAGKLK